MQVDSEGESPRKGVVYEEEPVSPAEELALAAMEKGAKCALDKGVTKQTVAEMAGLSQDEIRPEFAEQFSRIREGAASISTQGKLLEEAKKRKVVGDGPTP